MSTSEKALNLFILGDLVLDHLVNVVEKKKEHKHVGNENVYDVQNNVITAGGSANTARVLAALGLGRISLWGLTGRSPLGAFTDIIAQCYSQDGAVNKIIFHGTHAESRQMNTITRIVSVDKQGSRHHEVRLDEVSYVCTTDSECRDILNNLLNENTESKINAIILNDLNMNALTVKLVKAVDFFATKNEIPLFIVPKRQWEKYKAIKATCVLLNLNEWYNIVYQTRLEIDALLSIYQM